MDNFIVTLSLFDSKNFKVKEYHINLKFVSLVRVELGKVSIHIGNEVVDIEDRGNSNMRTKFLEVWEAWLSSFHTFSPK